MKYFSSSRGNCYSLTRGITQCLYWGHFYSYLFSVDAVVVTFAQTISIFMLTVDYFKVKLVQWRNPSTYHGLIHAIGFELRQCVFDFLDGLWIWLDALSREYYPKVFRLGEHEVALHRAHLEACIAEANEHLSVAI